MQRETIQPPERPDRPGRPEIADTAGKVPGMPEFPSGPNRQEAGEPGFAPNRQVGQERKGPPTGKGKKFNKEEIQKMTLDKNIQDNDPEDEKKLMSEWEQYMNDFVPEDINTVIIEPKSEIVTSCTNITFADILRRRLRSVSICQRGLLHR